MGIKATVLIILTIIYLYELALHLLRMRSAGNPVPTNVSDVYDPETYRKWKQYHGEKTRLGVMTSTVSWLIHMVLMALNAYAAFAGLFPVGGFLIWFHQALGDWMIAAFAGVLMIFILLFVFLSPVFSKIFNRFTPLEDGELKDRLTALLEKNGYRVRAIQVMDASRRTTKSNAYFSGFGKMKTIVLYDTLLEQMTPDEICAVFAHELGHGLHRDTLRNQVFSLLMVSLLAVLAWLTLRTAGLYPPFGFDRVNYGFAILLIMTVEFALVAPLFGLLTGYFSRKAEYRADEQAAKEGYGDDLVSGLKKLSRENLSDLSPSPLLVKLEYSHPTLSQRIDALEKLREKA